MAYKVLYRKYRPRTFSDVVGQNQVTDTLKSELVAGRIAHAFLFTGSRGTGKTTCSKILAKAVNCLNPQNGDPCLECENCIAAENGTMFDIMEIDAASNNRVDDVRTLIEEVAFTPAKAKYRVYIIDEVHELSQSAFNALLKTLEEPPEHAIFILATTEVHKLLATILSRCQRFDFRRITADDIADRLEYIANEENATITREAAISIAQIADGGMRDAISILDQCIGRDQDVTDKTVEITAGIASKQHLFSLVNSIIENNSAEAIKIIGELHSNSKDLTKLCEELISQFRHMMLIKVNSLQSNMIVMSEEELVVLKEQTNQINLSVILHCMDTLQITLDKMKYSNVRIELEMALVRLTTPSLDNSNDAIIRRIEALEERKPEIISSISVNNEKSVQTVKEVVVDKPTESDNSNKTVENLSANAILYENWAEVIHIVKSYSMTIGMAFNGSSAYTSNEFMLVDGSDMAFDYLRKSQEAREGLKNAIFKVTGKNYKIGPYKKIKKEIKKDDPLDSLENRAKEANIEIINK